MKETRWDSQGRAHTVNVVKIGYEREFVQPVPHEDTVDKGFSLETLTAVMLNFKEQKVH